MINVENRELIMTKNEKMIFVPMNDKDVVMACRYFDLIKNTQTKEKELEFKNVKKYFYDKGRYIKNTYSDNKKYPILISSS